MAAPRLPYDSGPLRAQTAVRRIAFIFGGWPAEAGGGGKEDEGYDLAVPFCREECRCWCSRVS